MRKHTTLINEVRERIVEMLLDNSRKPGDKFPSLRSLSQKLECSLMTVVKAVNSLTAEGILESRPRQGMFIARKPERFRTLNSHGNNRTLYFFYYSSALELDSYHCDLLQYLNRLASKKQWNFKLNVLDDRKALRQAIQDPNAVGIVLPALPRGDFLFNISVGSHVPLISYGMDVCGKYAGVCIDNFTAGKELSHYLLMHHYQRQIFLTTYPPSNISQIRLNGIQSELASYGLDVEHVFPWSMDSCTDQVLDFLKHYVPGDERCALIVNNCSMAMEIIAIAKLLGIRIPEDLGLVSFISRRAAERNSFITRMDFSHEDMGKAIENLLECPPLIQNKTLICLRMKLIRKGSILEKP